MYQPKIRDRLICATLYSGILIGGDFYDVVTWVPVVWIVVAAIRKSYLPDFIKYHCYQAILFNMIATFLPRLLKLLTSFIANILDLFPVLHQVANLLNTYTDHFIWAYFIFIKLVAAYAVIWTLRGRYTYIPPISQAVNLILR